MSGILYAKSHLRELQEKGFKAAVLFALIQNDALTLAGSAAHGGSRHEAKSVSTKSDGV